MNNKIESVLFTQIRIFYLNNNNHTIYPIQKSMDGLTKSIINFTKIYNLLPFSHWILE